MHKTLAKLGKKAASLVAMLAIGAATSVASASAVDSLVSVKDSNDCLVNYSSGVDGVVSTSFRYLATNTATAEYIGADQDPIGCWRRTWWISPLHLCSRIVK